MVMHLFPADLADRVGGREAVLMVAKRFYELSFEDPILGCLYEDKEEPHYKMFCRWLFTTLGLDDEILLEQRVGQSLEYGEEYERSSLQMKYGYGITS
mmetsp:Transcript_10951/g.9101  ORF Transcript_10951/g.9101 Transcript_10951/m.9101 type:complete len:98 (-) Transcript_10951:358-651(-)